MPDARVEKWMTEAATEIRKQTIAPFQPVLESWDHERIAEWSAIIARHAPDATALVEVLAFIDSWFNDGGNPISPGSLFNETTTVRFAVRNALSNYRSRTR